jgi:hypothetical protein
VSGNHWIHVCNCGLHRRQETPSQQRTKAYFKIHLYWYSLKHGFSRYMTHLSTPKFEGSRDQSWSWSYSSWIYNYLCNQCLSPQKLWVRISFRRSLLDTTLRDKAGQWLAAERLFSPSTLVTSTNKTGRNDITELLLKVVLSTMTLLTLLTRGITSTRLGK